MAQPPRPPKLTHNEAAAVESLRTERGKIDAHDALLTSTNLRSEDLVGSNLVDVRLAKIDAPGTDARSSTWLRCELTECRLSGIQLVECNLRDITIKGTRLDLANLRFSTFKRVLFQDCTLTETDFNNAELHDVAFIGCTLDRTSFAGCKCERVEIHGGDLSTLQGAAGLRGATITPSSLVTMLEPMAIALGLSVLKEE